MHNPAECEKRRQKFPDEIWTETAAAGSNTSILLRFYMMFYTNSWDYKIVIEIWAMNKCNRKEYKNKYWKIVR